MENFQKSKSELLLYKIDNYNGATFGDLLPEDPEIFDKMMEDTISHLKKVNKEDNKNILASIGTN